MKLSNERFEIEIISKSEFVDDYSAKNKNFLVTIWNIRISGEPLRNWMTSEIPCYDEVEFQRCIDERREFKEKIEKNCKSSSREDQKEKTAFGISNQKAAFFEADAFWRRKAGSQ